MLFAMLLLLGVLCVVTLRVVPGLLPQLQRVIETLVSRATLWTNAYTITPVVAPNVVYVGTFAFQLLAEADVLFEKAMLYGLASGFLYLWVTLHSQYFSTGNRRYYQGCQKIR